MHVVHLGFLLDPARTSAQILADWWPLVDTAEMVAATGVRVTVIQRCLHAATITRGAVTYHFLACAGRRHSLVESGEFARLLGSLQADVIHVHGLGFPRDVLALARLAPTTPIFLQDHASRVPRVWQRPIFRRAMAKSAGVSFCARAQAEPFIRAGLLAADQVVEIPECSSRFTPGDQAHARALTGVRGDPAVLWVGHLNHNKDPLTVLDAIMLASRRWPDLQLWCCFGTAPLRVDVERRIARSAQLVNRVHLIGKVPHATIELLMRAADVFMLGSHREGSGCAVIEALACGLPTVITDIPSYRALTKGGAVGALWSCGDSRHSAEALSAAAVLPRPTARQAVRAHFERELGFDAVGRKLVTAYRAVLGRR